MKAQFMVVEHDQEHNIVFIEDIANLTGGTTITNDAEEVVNYFRYAYGDRVRIVYLDTDQAWWEIEWYMHDPNRCDVRFRPWNGLVWDRLTKAEE